MLKKFIFFLFLSFLSNSCSRKASDYNTLVSTYKNILCSEMSSTKLSKEEREKGKEKLTTIKNECHDALKYLKQEEKEKFNQMLFEVEQEVAKGRCN
jgi:hypothetical protein